MNFKVYSFWLILSISTSIYCQHNYSKKQIDSYLYEMSKMVVDNPKCGLQVSTCFYNASVKSRYEIGHFFASVRMAKGNSSLDNYDIAIDLAKNKK